MIKDILFDLTDEEFDAKWQNDRTWINNKVISLGWICYRASRDYMNCGKLIGVNDYNDLSEYSVKLKRDFFALVIFRLDHPDTEIDIEKIIKETPKEDVNILIEYPQLIELTIAIVDTLK